MKFGKKENRGEVCTATILQPCLLPRQQDCSNKHHDISLKDFGSGWQIMSILCWMLSIEVDQSLKYTTFQILACFHIQVIILRYDLVVFELALYSKDPGVDSNLWH
jgi:hypothetical protein